MIEWLQTYSPIDIVLIAQNFDRFLLGAWVTLQLTFLALVIGGPAQPVQMHGVLITEDGKELILHQPLLQTGEHARLDHIAADRAAIGTGALVAGACAAEMLLADLDEAAAAKAAFEQS